jgi:hypothetical protein
MSHNLGSHVLSGLSIQDLGRDADDELRDTIMAQFMSYLQERMDFVARVSTEWPLWREPMRLIDDVVGHFFRQKLLMMRLLKDDRYAIGSATRERQSALGTISVVMQLPLQEPITGKWNGDEFEWTPREYRDWVVAIPGGAVGRQALFGFLENAMRNTARHNKFRQEGLTVSLELCQARGGAEHAGCYALRYEDDISAPGDTAFMKIEKTINTPLVDAYGKPTPMGWGLQEMKIYSQWLAYPRLKPPEHEGGAASDREGVALVARRGARPDGLVYELWLQKTVEVLSLWTERPAASTPEWDAFGVLGLRVDWASLDPTSDKPGPALKLVGQIREIGPALLHVQIGSLEEATRALKWIEWYRHRLPSRILLQVRNEDERVLRQLLNEKKLIGRVGITARDVTRGSADRFVVAANEEWVRELIRARGGEARATLVVAFQRDFRDSEVKEWTRAKSVADVYGFDGWLDCYVTADNCPRRELARWECANHSDVEQQLREMLSSEGAAVSIVLGNHARLSPSVDGGGEYGSYLVPSRDGAAGCVNSLTFDHVARVPTGFAGALFLLGLVESALLRVLVIDERVLGHYFRIGEAAGRNKVGLTETTRGQKFKRMVQAGIACVWSVEWASFGGAQSQWLLGDRARGVTCDSRPGLCPLAINSDGGIRVESPPDWADSNCQGSLFDCVVVHRTLLERLANEARLQSIDVLKSLGQCGARVVVTSGAGKPLDPALGTYPFVEFTVIDQYVLRQIHKPGLGRALMAAY